MNRNLTSKKFNLEDDHMFFLKLINDSDTWGEIEFKFQTVGEFHDHYKDLNGEWRVWMLNNKKVAITFVVEDSPSNNKPWLGTILVDNAYRMKGVARKVIDKICTELKGKGSEVVFTGIPINEYQWTKFICKCDFQQLKVEKSNDGNEYLILIRPFA